MDKIKYQQFKKLFNDYLDLSGNQQEAFLDDIKTKFPEFGEMIMHMIDSDYQLQSNLLDELPIQFDHTNTINHPPMFAVDQDKYHLVSRLNFDGLSNVFLSIQKHPVKRQVVIKFLNQLPNQSQLLAEAEFLASLNHPNIATLFEIGQTKDQRLFIVMEFVDGKDVVSYCKQQQLSISQKIKLFQQICAGIGHAHEKGIVHCDIKPSNILISTINNQPIVKIIDFGVSKYRGLDQKHQAYGTPQFMSPESLQDKKLFFDSRHDVYALGVLLYRLIYGYMPKNHDPLKTNMGHKDISAIINKAMATDRNHRYANSQSLTDDLQRYLDVEVVQARSATFGYFFSRFIQRNKSITIVVTALLVSIFIGFYAQLKQATVAKQARLEAEQTADFLVDLFSTANPDGANEDKVGIIDMIDQAKEKLLNTKKPSLTEARFMHTLSDIYSRLDRVNDSLIMAEKAWDIENNSLEMDSPELIDNLIQLGIIYRKVQKYDKAENNLKRAIELLKKHNNNDLTLLSYAYNNLGNLYFKINETELSIEQHELALLYRQKIGDGKLLADSYNNLAVQFQKKKKWQQSNDYYSQALKLYSEEYDEEHSYVYLVKSNMAYNEEQLHYWQQSEELALDAIKGFKKHYGNTHRNTQVARINLAKFYSRRMQFEKSIDLYNELIEIYQSKKSIHNSARYLGYLGEAYSQNKQYELSNLTHNKSIELAKTKKKGKEKLLTLLFYHFAQSLIRQKNYPLAQQHLELSLSFNEHKQSKYYFHLEILNSLGRVSNLLGDTAKAKKYFQQVLDSSEQQNTNKKIEIIRAFIGIGKIAQNSKHYNLAQERFNSALKLNESIYGKVHEVTAEILFQLGLLFKAQGQFDLAFDYFEKAFEIQNNILPKQHPALLKTIDQL